MSDKHYQFVPKSLNRQKYDLDKETFSTLLEQKEEATYGYTNFVTPYPFVLPKKSLDETKIISEAIKKGILAIVANYFHDIRIREILSLDEYLEEILQELSPVPYQIGSFRPDFLFDEDERIRVCEINARFPLNGIMMGLAIDSALEKVEYFPRDEFTLMPALSEIIDIFRSPFIMDKPITSVQAIEKGSDVYLFKNKLEKLGYTHNFVRPDEVDYKNGKFYSNGKELFQFIFELHREELTKLKPGVLLEICKKAPCYNDIRTHLLVHDKRVLTLLYNEKIMKDYLPDTDVKILKRHIVPSYLLTDEMAEEAEKSRKMWVLKKVSSGRGEGMLIGKECKPAEWNKALFENRKNYSLQSFIKQKEFPIVSIVDNKLVTKMMNVVGTIPNFNNSSLGPGMFRASQCSIINLHQGRGILMPALLSN